MKDRDAENIAATLTVILYAAMVVVLLVGVSVAMEIW